MYNGRTQKGDNYENKQNCEECGISNGRTIPNFFNFLNFDNVPNRKSYEKFVNLLINKLYEFAIWKIRKISSLDKKANFPNFTTSKITEKTIKLPKNFNTESHHIFRVFELFKQMTYFFNLKINRKFILYSINIRNFKIPKYRWFYIWSFQMLTSTKFFSFLSINIFSIDYFYRLTPHIPKDIHRSPHDSTYTKLLETRMRRSFSGALFSRELFFPWTFFQNSMCLRE